MLDRPGSCTESPLDLTMPQKQGVENPLQFPQGRKQLLRCLSPDHLNPTFHIPSSLKSASHAFSSHPLNLHNDHTSTTASSELFQPFTTRVQTICSSTRWLHVLSQPFSRYLHVRCSPLSEIGLLGDPYLRQTLNELEGPYEATSFLVFPEKTSKAPSATAYFQNSM